MARMSLTHRQRMLLAAVVREHRTSGRPVGSRTLVDRDVVAGSASTIRYELGRLEEMGLLEHPHTSAGRVPTDQGYRLYVDALMVQEGSGRVLALRPEGEVVEASARLDIELDRVTRALTDVTGLLALATAPATGGIVRHVEVLDLGAGRICTVCITADGDVARHVERFSSVVDAGLIQWAQEYVNERLTGVQLGRHLLRQCLDDPQLSTPERAVLAAVLPAFLELVESPSDVHLGGTPALLAALGDEVSQLIDLVAALDERRRLLESMSRLAGVAPRPGRVSIRIGSENDLPELRPLSVVGARYGTTGIPAGFVGVIGPRSMDYPHVVAAVAEAASHLGWTAAER